MRKLLTALIMISISTIMIAKEIDLSQSKGVNQKEIVSLDPAPADNSVKRGANIKIIFDKKLKAKHLQKSITLKYLGCKQEKRAKLRQRRDKKRVKAGFRVAISPCFPRNRLSFYASF